MENPLHALLRSHPGLAEVVDNAPRYRFQAVLGLTEEGPGGRPVLVQHGFRLGEEYFYPASTVKLFAAVAALERLAGIRRETGLPADADTALVFHPLFSGEELESSDDAGPITVRRQIRKIFLVSDNRAFNRLYELVGQDRLAASLGRAGLAGGRIVHRLEEARSPEENRRSPRIELVGEGFRHALPERLAEPLPPAPEIPGLRIGSAYLAFREGRTERIDAPMDFSGKNRFPLADLQRGLCMVMRPDVDCGGAGFDLSDDDRALLVEAMGQLPRESVDPAYDPAELPDDWVKFILPGLRRVVGTGPLRVYDKSGQAYGFTTENAYVVGETGRPFFLAATLFTNADGTLNDDRYEYETVALPFLADLGEAAGMKYLATSGH